MTRYTHRSPILAATGIEGRGRDRKRSNVYFDGMTWDRLKLRALDHEASMSTIIREMVAIGLDEVEGYSNGKSANLLNSGE